MAAKKALDLIAIEEDAVLDFQFALIDAMKETGFTRADLAKVLGVSRARISQMLDSEANPTLKVIARAMALLGRKVTYQDIERAAVKRVKDVHAVSLQHATAAIPAPTWIDTWAVQQNKRTSANENWQLELQAAA